jgi:hypothetical protein
MALVKTRQEMHAALDSVYTTRRLKPSLKVLVALSSFDVRKLELLAATERKLLKTKLTVNQVDDNLFRLNITKSMPGAGTIKGDVLIDVRDNSWLIITQAKMYFIRHAITPLLRVLYPQASQVFLNHIDMLSVLNRIKSKYHGSRTLTEFSAHTEEGNGDDVEIGSQRIKGANAEKKLLQLARKQRIWLDKVAYQVAYQVDDANSNVILESVIYSNGLSRLVFGNFTDFYRNVLGTVLEKTGELEKEYGRVKRDVVDDMPVLKPCLLRYEKPFQKSHIDALTQFLNREYAISVTNTGNPYFAAELLDAEEGSSFGLTLYDDVVTVIPMLHTTSPALWRLTANIQSALGEGALSVP